MRGAHYALLGAMVLSCATQTDAPLGGLGNTAGEAALAGSGGIAVGTGGNATAGSSMATGGAGSPSGGFGNGGISSVGGGGPFGTAGTFGTTAGAGGTPAGGGGAGGVGGKATGGGGMGGKATGGGGSGGTGGVVKCGDNAIRAKAQWTASASDECAPTCSDPNGPFTAALAIDADVATRFATGKAQAGDEWLQIDLGAVGTVNHLTINTTSATDYTRHYQVRVSNTSVDMAAQVLADAAGATGTIAITLSKTVNGRFVLISQTGNVGAATSWWSVNDVTVTCQ